MDHTQYTTNGAERKPGTHLTMEDRGAIQAMKKLELPEAIKRKKHRKSPAKRKKVYRTSIDERPEIVDSRTEEGHWEGDTVVGKRNGKESVILTLLEKKTQNYIAIRIPGKTSEAVNTAMERLHEEFGEKFCQVFRTITVDNGAEFADFAQIEKDLSNQGCFPVGKHQCTGVFYETIRRGSIPAIR